MMCIGYIGCEAFDIILYTGRTLTKLNYRVLIIDLSGTGAMTKAIHHGMELDSAHEIVNYRDINYTTKIPDKEEWSVFGEGVVLVAFGMNYKKEPQIECQRIQVVTNTYPHVMDSMNALIKDELMQVKSFDLLIRDVITIDDVDCVKKSLVMKSRMNKMNYLFLDLSDYESAVKCQVTQIICFTKISIRMRKFILEHIRDNIGQIKPGKISNAMKAAKRGA